MTTAIQERETLLNELIEQINFMLEELGDNQVLSLYVHPRDRKRQQHTLYSVRFGFTDQPLQLPALFGAERYFACFHSLHVLLHHLELRHAFPHPTTETNQ